MEYTREVIEEMLGNLRFCLNDAFGILQELTENDVDIKHLPALFDVVEAALNLSTEVLDHYNADVL